MVSGGSGGHIYPALSLINEIKNHNKNKSNTVIVFQQNLSLI